MGKMKFLPIRSAIIIAVIVLGLALLLFTGPSRYEQQAYANTVAGHCRKYCLSEEYGWGIEPEYFKDCLRDCLY